MCASGAGFNRWMQLAEADHQWISSSTRIKVYAFEGVRMNTVNAMTIATAMMRKALR